MDNFSFGRKCEDIATKALLKKGYRIINRNVYSRYGELDIVCLQKDWLVFIEVKSKHIGSSWPISKSLNVRKKIKIHKTIQWWINKNNCFTKKWRFDFVGVTIYSQVKHTVNHIRFVNLPVLNKEY